MSDAVDPERALALSYAPLGTRAGLEALFALDATLGAILRTTREPLVGQMRLTWWHDALVALDAAPPPAQPVLQALAEHVLPHGVSGARLAGMIDGWEALLDDPIGAAAIELHAARRGAALFEAAGMVLGATADPLGAAGAGWALADLARNLREAALAGQAVALARPLLAQAAAHRWNEAGRALGALVHSARADLAVPLDRPIARGGPRRVARLAWHRLSGR